MNADAQTTEVSGIPPRDDEAILRVASQVQLNAIEMVASYFQKRDMTPLPGERVREDLLPEIALEAEWDMDEERGALGCLVTFGVVLPDPPPYTLMARYRVLYELADWDTRLEAEDLDQFANWEAVFNAWPYWREYLSSMLNRAHLPRFVAPLVPIPTPPVGAQAESDPAVNSLRRQSTVGS